jgi:2'-5' RNA ligase
VPVAIILTFDPKSTIVLNRVFKALKEHNFNSYDQKIMPHITLTWYANIDNKVAERKLEQFCSDSPPFRIQFSSIGYFSSEESVLFLNPNASFELLDIQQKVFELLEEFHAGNSPKIWVPHCTLALDIPIKKIGKAIDIIKEYIRMAIGEPFNVNAQAICSVDFKTDPLKVISLSEFKLKKRDLKIAS